MIGRHHASMKPYTPAATIKVMPFRRAACSKAFKTFCLTCFDVALMADPVGVSVPADLERAVYHSEENGFAGPTSCLVAPAGCLPNNHKALGSVDTGGSSWP